MQVARRQRWCINWSQGWISTPARFKTCSNWDNFIFERCHREGEAIKVFEAVLKRDPSNSCAKFWLAHCCLRHLMDPDAIQRAAGLLESVIRVDPQHAGAAYMLLSEVLEEEGNLAVDKKIQLLEGVRRSRTYLGLQSQELGLGVHGVPEDMPMPRSKFTRHLQM